jgi:hypothetical protein
MGKTQLLQPWEAVAKFFVANRKRANIGDIALRRLRTQIVKHPHKSPHSENLVEVGDCL